MRITDDGNVGIGTTGPESRVQITGGGLCVGSNANCNTDNNTEGTVYSGSTAMTVYDVAEMYPTTDTTLTPAEVVALDPERGVFVKRASHDPGYPETLLGVISTQPGVLLGGFAGTQFKGEHQVAVALSGRVPVKVSQEAGAIKIGDRLTLSSIAGVAKKATSTEQTIGIALEPFPSPTATSTIQVFVNLGYSRLSPKIVNGVVSGGPFSGIDSIYSEYYSTSTPALFIASTGNLGIGTTSPQYTLHVEGDIAARSFVNISTRTAKTDIVRVDGAGEETLLRDLLSATTTRYKYIGDTEAEEHLGLIAEEAPSSIQSSNGKGIDLYKMATALLAGMKAQERKIQELDTALSSLVPPSGTKLGTTNAWSVDQTSGKVNVSFFGDLNLQGNSILDVKKITGYLGKWSIDEDGTLMAVRVITDEIISKRIETETLKVKGTSHFGTPEKPQGITLYDEITKEPYCVKVKGGAVVSEAGTCGSVVFAGTEVLAPEGGETSTAATTTAAISDSTTATSTPVTAETTATSTPATSETASTTVSLAE